MILKKVAALTPESLPLSPEALKGKLQHFIVTQKLDQRETLSDFIEKTPNFYINQYFDDVGVQKTMLLFSLEHKLNMPPNPEIVQFLLDNGADPNVAVTNNGFKKTPFEKALEKNLFNICTLLHNNGADTNSDQTQKRLNRCKKRNTLPENLQALITQSV
ncbi:hypothetical protein DID77_01565 [Candidatus Marinamargulisbacteria bacterium SCGC AG-439-L15]|nr:hypothetical protein DID77_01565 [Candidatus Marinamargulisbacteria bacterium SCGC AG-439-L15]